MADETKIISAEQLAENEQTAEVKELIKRYGHTRALVDTTTGDVHFDKDYIERLEKKNSKLTGLREIKA